MKANLIHPRISLTMSSPVLKVRHLSLSVVVCCWQFDIPCAAVCVNANLAAEAPFEAPFDSRRSPLLELGCVGIPKPLSRLIVQSICADIMMESGFEVAISSFCRSKCNVFDDNDENKLEYMTVFRDYVGLIEESLDRELEARIKDFTMTRFLQELGQRSPDDLDGEVFEMLLTVTDFESFKAQMLSYKTESELAGLMPRVTSVQVHSNEQEAGDVRPDLDRSLCVSPVKATCH